MAKLFHEHEMKRDGAKCSLIFAWYLLQICSFSFPFKLVLQSIFGPLREQASKNESTFILLDNCSANFNFVLDEFFGNSFDPAHVAIRNIWKYLCLSSQMEMVKFSGLEGKIRKDSNILSIFFAK